MAQTSEKTHQIDEEEHQTVFAEKAGVEDYKAGAIEAENGKCEGQEHFMTSKTGEVSLCIWLTRGLLAEHNMTVIEAVKQYPMASFWVRIFARPKTLKFCEC